MRCTSFRQWTMGVAALLAPGMIWAAAHTETAAPVSAVTSEDLERLPARPIDELITTARRTEENVLEVPIAITTFSADQIERAGIENITDIAANTPGLSFANFFGEELPKPVIRGVAPLDIFGESNTAIYIDGIYVSSSTGINFGFLDIERIEVLKGPQGAYFGNNAFSGAINYVTARPTDEFSGRGEIQLGDNGKQVLKASVSGPLVGDVLSGRFSALYDDFDGTYDNPTGRDQDIDGAKYKALSGSLFFNPTDTFSAQLNLYLSDDEIDPPAQSTTPANCEPSLNSADNGAFLNYCGEVPSAGKDDIATIDGETGQTREVQRVSLKLDWDVGFGTFSSLTGYSRTKDQSFQNGSPGSESTIFKYRTTNPSGPFFLFDIFDAGGLLITTAGKDKNQDFSQELRFTSPQENRARYTAGLYYFKQQEDNIGSTPSVLAENPLPADFGNLCPVCVTIVPPNPGAPFGAGISPVPVGNFIFLPWFSGGPVQASGITSRDVKDYAVFGSIEYDITDRLTGYAELRYTDREVDVKRVDGSGALQAPLGDEEYDTDYVTWRGSLSWALNDTAQIYGSIAQGEKGGGVDTFEIEGTGNPALDETIGTVVFGSETNLTYELGYKAAYWDGRILTDLAVYYTEWDDLVLRNLLTTLPGSEPPIVIQPVGVSLNSGDAEILGLEFGVNAQLTDMINAGLGFSYNDTEVKNATSDRFADFPTFGPSGDVSGNELPRQPDTQVNANLTFRNQFSGDWDWYARGDVYYQSKWYVDLPNQAEVPGRTRANLRLGLESEQYTVELFSTNIFDDDTPDAAYRDPYFSNVTQDGTTDRLFPWRMSISQPQRRVVGLRLIGRFGG